MTVQTRVHSGDTVLNSASAPVRARLTPAASARDRDTKPTVVDRDDNRNTQVTEWNLDALFCLCETVDPSGAYAFRGAPRPAPG
jgi:hypothetical protein